MKTFPMTELVIDVLDADGQKEGKEIAIQLVALAKKGNATLLKLLYDRIQPTATPPEDEPLTDEQRRDILLRVLDRTGKTDAGQGPQG